MQPAQKLRWAQYFYKGLVLLVAVFLGADVLGAAAPQSQQLANAAQEPAPESSLPLRGGHEWQVWVEAAPLFSVDGSSKEGHYIYQLGGRYGWILTNVRGPGSLRGQLEYAVDFIPLVAIAQLNETSHGFSFNAFSLKWNFQPHRQLVPYAYLSGGGLITNHGVPPDSATFNFTCELTGGVHFIRGKNAWSIGLGVAHISNAGTVRPNSAFNSMQLRVGFGRFTQAHYR